MNPIAIKLGSLTVTWYAIFILSGIILASILISKESNKYNIQTNFVTNLIFWCVIFGILGARVYYVIFNLDYYLVSPIEIIKIWNGGLAIHGGIIAGIITLIVYCKKYKVNPILMADISTPCVMLAQGIGRWGNFFNSEAHGGIVSRAFLERIHIPNFIIEGMHIGNHYYHPTFFYESFFCILGFIILTLVKKSKKIKLGNITSLYFIWYGVLRFFIESLRTDSLMIGNIKMAQVVSCLMVIIGIIAFIITTLKCKKYNKNWETIFIVFFIFLII